MLTLEISNLGRLQLKLKLICDKGNEFRICGFAFRVADSIAEKSLECVQIAPVPGYFNGMADSSLDSAGRGLEGLCHLGVQYLGDGIHGLVSPLDGLPEVGNLEGFL